jgi:RNA polymerase sigma-70 factor (ECF subfamily)
VTESASRPKEDADKKALAATQARFTEVYQHEFAYVWRSLSRLGAPAPAQEDLAHDVFAIAYRQWSDYDPARPLRPWLFGIAYRVVLDWKRKAQNTRESATEIPEGCDPASNQEETLGNRQALAQAARALAALELDRRTVFIMHELDEQTMPEIAAALDIPLNTAYSRLRLARRDFNEQVAALRQRTGGSR